MKMKVVTKRFGKSDPIEDAAGLLKTMRQIRGDPLIPKGVYRFSSMKEAHQWMIKKMASTHVLLNSKT